MKTNQYMVLQWKLFNLYKDRGVRFFKRKFVCLFMPSGVHELSLNNTDWILKYFFVHKKPTRKHCITSIVQKWEDMAVVVLDQNHHWTDTERKITENGKLLKVHPLFIQTKKDLNKQINYLKIKVLWYDRLVPLLKYLFLSTPPGLYICVSIEIVPKASLMYNIP